MAEPSRGTVLVVDDEPTIVEIVGRYIERAGFAVERAGDGLEALRLAELHRPDLVVLDVMLPGPVVLLAAGGEQDDGGARARPLLQLPHHLDSSSTAPSWS